MRRLHDDSGATLIELLLAMFITSVVMSVVAASLILGLKGNKQVSERLLDSHDAQLVSVYLPSDMLSVRPDQIVTDPAAGTGCAASPSEPWNVLRLTWSEEQAAGTFVWSRVSYRVVQNGTDWRLARVSCTAPTEPALSSAAPAQKLLSRNLQSPTAGLPTAVVDGDRLKMRLTDLSGYSYTLAVSRRMLALPGVPAAPRPRPVEISQIQMLDVNRNGRIDRLVVSFSGALPAACTSASYFQLASVPSDGSRGSVTFSGSDATISVNEGTGAPDTGIGDFRLQFNPATGCDALAYDGPPTRDLAVPVVTQFVSGPASSTNPVSGLAEAGDSFIVAFSEPVSGFPASGDAVLAAGTLNTLEISGVTSGALSLGSALYFGGNRQATFPYTSLANATNSSFTITLTACGPTGAQNQCDLVLPNAVGGLMTYVPASTIVDAAGNSATPLASNPVPTGIFRAF